MHRGMNVAMKRIGAWTQWRQAHLRTTVNGDIKGTSIRSHRMGKAVVISHTQYISALNVASDGESEVFNRDLTGRRNRRYRGSRRSDCLCHGSFPFQYFRCTNSRAGHFHPRATPRRGIYLRALVALFN